MGLKAKLYFLTALAIGAPSAAHALSGRVPHPGPDVGPIDMAMQSDGKVSTPLTSVAPGEIVGTMPFKYVRTAILASDLKGRGGLINDDVHELTQGSPGFFVGRYRTETQFASSTNDLWCFLPSRVGNVHESVCVLIFGIDRGALAVSNSNPFWVDPSVAKWPRGKPIFPVSIQEQPVTITDTPVLEYRFLGWTSGGAHVAFLVAHREVGQYDVKFEPDGSVHLGLIGGSYIRLVRDHDDPNSAVSIFLATGATMTP